MRNGDSIHPHDWQVSVRVQIERAGRILMGKGRLQLLEGIERRQSISAAARDMKMSYRQAWLLVQYMNEATGSPLVVTATGGSGGGGAQLTPLGNWALKTFREFQDQVQRTATALWTRMDGAANPAILHVAAAVALEEVLGQLLADFALQQPGVRVRAVYGSSNELADHVLQGAPTDLFLAAACSQIDRLEAAGVADPSSRAVLGESRLVIIGPTKGFPAIASCTDLLKPKIKRIALAEPTSPLGTYTQDYLTALGLYDAVLARAVEVDNAKAVTAAVRGGQADVGVVYHSVAQQAAGCRLLHKAKRGPVPILFTGSVLCQGQQTDQARALLNFLASRPAAARFRRCGFLPVR